MFANIQFLNGQEEEQIHRATLEVLEKTGFNIYSAKVRDLLAKKGAKVSGDNVRFPKALVEECLKMVNKNVVLAGRNPAKSLQLPGGQFPYSATSGYSPFVLDKVTGQKRRSTGKDLKEFAVLCDALDQLDFFWPIAMPTEDDDAVQELTALDIALRNMSKHVQCSVSNADLMDWQIRLASVIAGGEDNLRQNPIFSVVAAPLTPLCFEGIVAEAIIKAAEAGIPVAPMTVAQAGTTSPATIAATVLLVNIEEIATLVIAKCANPDAPLIYAADAGAADLRTGFLNYESPEYYLLGVANAQMARYYDLPSLVSHGTGEVRDFHNVAGFERNIQKAAMSMMTKTDLSAWFGSLENSINGSLIDVYLDAEVCRQAKAYVRSYEVNSDTLAVDLFAQVGPGGHFLAEEHSFKHFRQELWLEKFTDSFVFKEAKDGNFRRAAQEKIDQIIASHQVLPISADVEKEMDMIMAMARKELIAKAK